MADQAHEWTDEEIERLERRFRRQYNQASREMRKRLDDMMESYDKANAEWKQRVKSGDATQEDYDGWLKGQATDRAFVQSMAQTLAQDANRTNQLAMDTVNDVIPSVFAENANYAAFEVERGIGYETHAFDLYDQSTVRRLIRDQPDLLPPLPNPRMDNGRDLRWNRQRFAGVITQSVLQGESIPKAAERIGRVMRTNEAAATRAARTALTGAENAGRIDSYRRAQNIGIELEQEWLATHDERTRITHRLLDGEHVPVGERFVPDGYGDKYSIGFPGDPTALGEMVYNCRCTLVAWLPSIAKEDNRSWAKLPDGMTYDEWKHGKKLEEAQKNNAKQEWQPEDIGISPKRPRQDDFSSYDEYLDARSAYRQARRDFADRKQALIDEIVNRPTHGFETEAAVREWAAKVGIDVTDDVFRLIDQRVIDDAVYTLDSLFGEYPQVQDMFSKFGSKFRIGVEELSDCFMEANGGLNINPREASTYRDAVTRTVDGYTMGLYNEAVGRDLLSQVRGDGTLRTIVTHEFGHNLDSAVQERFVTYGPSGDPTDFILDHDGLNQYNRELMDLTRAHTVSDYSMTNESEAFAEGFAEYVCNPDSEYAKAFGDFLKRWL